MEPLRQDLFFGLRMLARNPLFTVVAVLTLAIGIGANTAVFSLGNALLLRPLPFRDPDRLVWVDNPDPGGEGIPGLTSQPNFRDWCARNESFQNFGAFLPSFTERSAFTLTGNGEPVQLRGAYVSGNLLDLLGIPIALGRAFTEEECQRNGPKVILLTDAFWRRLYGADRSLVGRTLTISGASWMVVGILPPEFDYGFSAVFRPGNQRVDFLLPYKPHPGYDNFGNMMAVIGRLKPGLAIKQAQNDFDLLNRQLQDAHPERGKFAARLSPLRERVSGSHRRSFLVLACAVGAVLLIACANLSNLLLARGASRRHEMAVRLALGADRVRLVRQMLSESLLLATAGGAVGLPLAYAATTWIGRNYAFNIPLLETARVDCLGLAATALATAFTALLFGTVPAVALSTAENGMLLNDGARDSSPGPRTLRLGETFVIVEVAMTYLLLVGAGLLVHSLMRLLDVDPGFRPENALAIRIQTYRQFEKQTAYVAYYQDLLRRVQQIPGIDSATLPDKLPLALNDMLKAQRKGEAVRPDEASTVFVQLIDQSYFATFGIPLRAGRAFNANDPRFDWEDPKTKVAVVNQKMAASFWPGQSALGKSVILESFPQATAECTIVGVVGDVRESALEQKAGPEIYVVGNGGSELVVRTRAPFNAMIPLIRSTLHQIDPDIAIAEFRPLARIIDQAVAPRRLICSLLGAFSSAALALAAMGIYGVMAYSVCQRTKEFGIRLALGSSRRALLGLILRQGIRLALLGCAIGIAGSLALMRTIQSLLFGVGPTDPLPLVLSAILAVSVMLLASWLPAYRASTLDPIASLRT